tara:strand:- start:15756 stop:18074 length:2319 start_codon:yes stop_codon:yes gene_type:complete
MSTTVEYKILVEVLSAVKDLKKVTQETKKTGSELDKTNKSGLRMAADLGSAFTGLKNAASTVANAFKQIAGTASAAAQGAFELTRSVVDQINDLNDLSVVSGVSAQNIEALKLAFVSSGQAGSNANIALKSFPRVLNELSNNSSRTSKLFKALKISFRDANDQLKDGDTIFKNTIQALQGIEDKTLRARAAQEIFKRSGAAVVQALGAGAFNEMADAADRLGTKLSPDASEKAAIFQKRLALMALITTRVKQTLVEATGGVEFFDSALVNTIAGLKAFTVGVKTGSSGLGTFARGVIRFANVAIGALIDAVVRANFFLFDLVQRGINGFVGGLNRVSKAITGKALVDMSSFKKTLGEFTIEQLGLTEAAAKVQEAFKGEVKALNASTDGKEADKKSTSTLTSEMKELSNALDSIFNKQDKTTKETKKGTKATNDAKKAEKARASGMRGFGRAFGSALKAQTEAFKQAEEISKSATSDIISNLQKINDLESERLSNLLKIEKTTGVSQEAIREQVKARAQRDRIVEGVGVGTRAVGALGDPSSLIDVAGSLAGPIGSAVAGAVNALSALGQKDPAELKAEFEATFQGIAKGLNVAIPLIFEMLPPILFQAAGMIIDAIIQLPFQIIAGIASGFRDAITGLIKFFEGGFFEGLGNFFSTLFENLMGLITSPFEAAFGGGFLGGGRMLSGQGGLRFTGKDQGLALLHPGETVVPRSGQVSSTVAQDIQAQAGGGSIVININSAITERSAIDALVRKIEDRFGSFGQSTSPLFGGL